MHARKVLLTPVGLVIRTFWFGDPLAGGELPDERPVAVVQILETGLAHPPFGFLEAPPQRPILTGELLGIDEHGEAFVETQRRGGRIALSGKIRDGHRA